MADTGQNSTLARGARSALALLLTINLFNYIDRQVLAGVVRRIQQEFSVSDAQVGWLAPAFLLSYMVAAPLFGWLADRYNRWLLVGIGVLVWSLASGASGLAMTFAALLITRLFVGIGEAAYGPTAPTILSDMYPVERRGRILAFFYVAIPVGSALGYLLAGLVGHLGWSWRWAFYCVVPPGILLGLLSLWMRDFERGAADRAVGNGLPSPLAGEGAAKSVHVRHATLSDYALLVRTPSYVLTSIGMIFMTFALGGIGFWMPKYIVWRQIQAGALDPQDDAAVKSAEDQANSIFGPVVAMSGLLGTIAGGWVGDRLRTRLRGAYLFVSGAAMILAFPLFLAMLVTPFPVSWVLVFIACFALFFNTGPTNTVLANVVHPSMRAAGYALNIFAIHILGDAISPPLIGLFNDLWGSRRGDVWSGNMNAGFLAISGTILCSGLFWIWGARHLDADTDLAPGRI
jgi:MFS family permease